MKNKSLVRQVDEVLNSKIDFGGIDKHNNKKQIYESKIVSRDTLRTYKHECCNFVKWVKSKHPEERFRTLDDCRPYASDYLHRTKPNGEQYSAWTVHTRLSAIAKLYGVPLRDICADAPKRHRADITRSRLEDTTTDKAYSLSRNLDAEMLGRAAGLRKSEFSRVTTECVHYNQNGDLVVIVDKGKGGKAREIVVDPAYREQVIALRDRTPPGERLIPKGEVPAKLDEHALRRAYAKSMLQHYSRPLDTLSKSEKYYCRKDKSGVVLDRQAMALVSRSLGHGSYDRRTGEYRDRIDVIAGYYI